MRNEQAGIRKEGCCRFEIVYPRIKSEDDGDRVIPAEAEIHIYCSIEQRISIGSKKC